LRERVAAPTWFEEGVCASIRFVSSVWGNIVTPHGLAPRARFRFGPDAGVNLAATLKNAGTKNQRRNRREKQSTMTARPRGAFCSPPSPSREPLAHTNNHCQSGHQHGAKAREARLQCGADGIFSFRYFFVAKLTTKMLVGGCDPMHMMVPMSAGTLKVVCVINKTRQCRECRGQRGS